MLKHFDHVTVAVTDPAAAIGFFALLGFELDKDVVIKGPVMDQYMGIDGLEARATSPWRSRTPGRGSRSSSCISSSRRPGARKISRGWTASASITSASPSPTSMR
jgi:hypothetical protein